MVLEKTRVPWTARRANQSILKEISPECSLEGLLLKLKLQYFCHLMQRTDSFEKTLMLRMIEGGRRGARLRMGWLDGITHLMDMSLGPGVDGTGDRSKFQCCKEQYCIGTWNVRSMNQGKLEVVKREMARVNVDILGISKLKWTGMGELNSDDHYIYYCGQKSLRRNGAAIMVNKRVNTLYVDDSQTSYFQS